MAQLFANAARSTLTASITSSSTQLQINPADQALFPVATGADWFKVALEDSSGNLEYMRVQRAVGQSLLTITERATEDATKFPARSFVAGSLVELRMTAADLASSIAHPSVGTGAHAATAISVTAAGGISATTVQAALQELDTEKANAADVTTALDGKASTGANTFTGAQTLPGNAANNLEAVPKQQAESLIAEAVANRMEFIHAEAVATTSGSSFNFDIPAWAKRITFIPHGVSTNGSQGWKLQFLANGVLVTSNCRCVSAYVASGSNTAPWTDRVYDTGSSAPTLADGGLMFWLSGSNRWDGFGVISRYNDNAVQVVAGGAALAGALTGVRLSTNSSDTFDGGYFTVLIEG